ncbi:hypothetical protein IJH66_00940 [Candidatus Saccharibacteria bacterium]|nr:hypothetical protein [Candidatus Saccharibacteria bacterium]
MSKQKTFGLIIRAGLKPFPNRDEITCGSLLSEYFRSNIEFLPSSSNSKSPDFLIEHLNQRWELKTIYGNTKNTIHHAFERSNGQSENLIISLKRTKMRPKSAIAAIKRELKISNKKRIILISKEDKIVVIKQ